MKKNKYYFIGLGACLVLFFTLQFSGPLYVRSLFDHGQLGVLNRLTDTASAQSLDFYWGRAQELVWGPALQVLSGLMLILLILGALKKVSWPRFFWIILGFLVVTKWEVLLLPPYGDSVGGPFAEGWWLARNHFDYIGLFHQPGYAAGGPKVYMWSLFPTYLAVMYKIFPPIKLFLIANHLVFFAMAAALAAFVREIARRIFSAGTAGLLAVLVLSWPIFQTQLEAINMELPSLFFAMLCARELVRGRMNRAGLAALLSLAFKGSGIFACGAFFCYGFLALGRETEGRRKVQWVAWGLGLMVLAVLSVALKFWMGDQHTSTGIIKLFAGWPSLKIFKVSHYYLADVCFCLGLWAFQWWRARKEAARFNISPESWRVNVIMLIFAGMWFFLFLHFQVGAPRYRLALYPFLIFTLFWAFAQVCSKKTWQIWALCGMILFVQFHAYGWNRQVIPNDYVLLEDNLQYRNDLKLYQKLAARIEERDDGMLVVAPFIAAQILAVPDFGYVSKPRAVVVYGFNCTYGGIQPYPGMAALDVMRTIYITMESDSGNKAFPYPIHPNDKVVDVVEWGSRKAWIFMGGISIDLMRKIQNYMLSRRGK